MAGGRTFSLEITGTFVATVTLQRSSGNENDYQDWRTYTAPTSESIYDAQDNQTWYYRLIVKPGNYTSGTVVMTLRFQGGTTTGYVRVIEYATPTSVTAEVVKNRELASTAATKIWSKGAWNATDGFPRALTRGYGRLWMARKSTLWSSQSDNFISFEPGTEANQAIVYQIAAPANDSVRWLSMLNVLCVGTSTQEFIGVAMTSNEAVGPTNFQLLDASEEGGSVIPPVTAGNSVLYVHKSGRKLMQFTQNPKALSETSYISVDLTARAPEIFDSPVVGMAVQRDPERRIYVWMESGRLAELLFRREADLDVVAWSDTPTDGRFEGTCVMATEEQDIVYHLTRRRNSAGSWVRAVERYGRERIIAPDDRGVLDAAKRVELEKPATVATPSGLTGSITVTTDDDAFVVGDVGSVLWINRGFGPITGYTNAKVVTVALVELLASDQPAAGGTWGFGPNVSTVTGLSHLEGRAVRMWADGKDMGLATVASGQVTLPQAASMAVVGLHVRSRWKSLKLAYGAQKGSAVTMPKAIKGVGLALYETGDQLTIGPSWDKQWLVKTRTTEAWGVPTRLYSGEQEKSFDGGFGTDARFCVEVDGPAPATLAGWVPRIDERDR